MIQFSVIMHSVHMGAILSHVTFTSPSAPWYFLVSTPKRERESRLRCEKFVWELLKESLLDLLLATKASTYVDGMLKTLPTRCILYLKKFCLRSKTILPGELAAL